MKKFSLILLTTQLFIVLFYEESLGINLSIFAIFLAFFTFYKTPKKNKTRLLKLLGLTTLLSSIAFAWFGDFISFLAVFSSLLLLNMKSKNQRLKSFFVLPVLLYTVVSFVCRLFSSKDWLPQIKSEGLSQKIIAVLLIPLFFIFLFFVVYTYGSDQFAQFFSNINLDFNFFYFAFIAMLGFFIAFNYWHYWVPRWLYKENVKFSNNFVPSEIGNKPTFSFLHIDFERLSGIVTLMALNGLILIFIFSYNYEQFYVIPKTPVQLSAETHERVNTVIMSIVMAIFVIMFYFKGGFNFDQKAGLLKISAKIWIFLNAVLVSSALLKNTEYVHNLGLTYKRLGVYAFLLLSIIGLIMTFIKIQKSKTNAFLFNQMIGYFYGTILVCSYLNWGGIITEHNMKRPDFDLWFHIYDIHFNEKKLLEYAKEKHDENLKNILLKNIEHEKQKSQLSQILYYQTLP